MSTEAQINANRKNAKESTGPKTPEGKAKVAQNATRHGLTATADVIKGESQEEFDAHKQALLDELNPQTTLQQILADRVASLTWRLKRAERMQNQFVDQFIADHQEYELKWRSTSYYLPSETDPDLILGYLAKKDYKYDKVLERLTLYERRIENSFFKSLGELERQKRKKPRDPSSDPNSVAHPASMTHPNSVAHSALMVRPDSVAHPPSIAHPDPVTHRNSVIPANGTESRLRHCEEQSDVAISTPNAQNKPNSQSRKINVTSCHSTTNNQHTRGSGAEDKPNQSDSLPSESTPVTGQTRRTSVTKTTTRRY